MAPPHVVIFGETGAGKSSLVNLIAGKATAAASAQAQGCTLASSSYAVNIDGMDFILHDTAGLGEGNGGAVTKHKAFVQLYSLLRTLDPGVSLLIFCMRAPRITESCVRDWRIVHDIFCLKSVPVILAVTGLENEDNQEDWWNQNHDQFMKYDICPSAVACTTATRGKRQRGGHMQHIFDDVYEESQVKMRNLIRTTYRRDPWKVPVAEWSRKLEFADFADAWSLLFGSLYGQMASVTAQQLSSHCQMPKEEVIVLGRELRMWEFANEADVIKRLGLFPVFRGHWA